MEKLEELGDITRLSEHVVRVLGQNPGKFTLQGTNTYIIGSQNPYILIDTAEGLPSYIPLLSSALTQGRTNPTLPDISDIIISHWHHDHTGGIPSVLTLLSSLWESRPATTTNTPYTPPRLHKYPTPPGTQGNHTTTHNKLPSLLSQLPPHLYTPSPSGSVFHDLADSQTIQDSLGTPLLRVLHTPGHTIDSICLYIPQDRALYTADTVLGHGTAVFEDLGTYLSSLNKMLHFGSTRSSPPPFGQASTEIDRDLDYVTLYPAHGAIVSNGRETIATYIKHRLEREAQVLAVLRSPIPEELIDNPQAQDEESTGKTAWTTWNLVRIIYKSYPESLWLPAARSIDLHLRKLEGDGVIRKVGSDAAEAQYTRWEVVGATPSL